MFGSGGVTGWAWSSPGTATTHCERPRHDGTSPLVALVVSRVLPRRTVLGIRLYANLLGASIPLWRGPSTSGRATITSHERAPVGGDDPEAR